MDIAGSFEWVPQTFYAIFRNKRRSFAMISGIILGTVILSGIVIYTSVLKTQNFNSVVNSAPYEVRFDITQDENMSSLHQLQDLVMQNNKVRGSVIMASKPSSGDYIVSVAFDVQGDGKNNLDTNTGNLVASPIEPIFVQPNFQATVIGQRVASKIDEGSFNIGTGNTTVLPRSIASQLQLSVGDTINTLNITYSKVISSQQFIVDNFKGSIKNVLITGIYDDSSSDSSIFSSILNEKQFYLSVNLLTQYLPSINNQILKDQGYFLAVKIDENKFTVSDPSTMNTELNTFINEISKESQNAGLEVVGINEISGLLLPFTITSIFLTIFDVLLAAPVVILSLYLLFFGLEMSLEERRREIAIKKVQGADSKQIFSELRNESIIMFIIGTAIGYIGGIFGAWIIKSAVGFMNIKLKSSISANFNDFLSFFRWDSGALLFSAITVGLILALQINRQGKQFIEQEVSEAVQRFEIKKEGFIRKNKVDVILFLIGVANFVISLLEQGFGINLNLNFLLALVINGLGPFFLWIGGAMVGARVSKYVPIKLEKLFLNLVIFKDISRIIKSGLRRRGDTNRLAIIIVLTLSIATLAAAQGATDQYNSIRTTQWQVGADFQVNFLTPGNYYGNITKISGVDDALGIGFSPSIGILSSTFQIAGFNVSKEYNRLLSGNSIGIWHPDAFPNLTPIQALKAMSANQMGIFMSQTSLNQINANVGDKIKLKITIGNPTSGPTQQAFLQDITILGVYDHMPGSIITPTIISSSVLVQRIRSLASNHTQNYLDNTPFNASEYLVKTIYGSSITETQINNLKASFNTLGSPSAISLKQELDQLTSKNNFGVPGLLSLNFLVAVTAAIISTFTFSAIIMERRKREFAVLRAIGARKSQIYKLALAENFLLVATSVIWGSLIGVGITYQFNGVFELFGVFFGSGPLNRIVLFPILEVSIIGIFTTIGMLIATVFSVRGAANQDLSTATRVI